MKVEWNIYDMELEAWIPGFLAEITHDGFDQFKAKIASINNPHEVLINKTDPSLIELMNWAEEELKFRESHGQ